jgi:Domain of unknown function (DUF4292)
MGLAMRSRTAGRGWVWALLLLAACPPPRVEFGPDGAPRSLEELLAKVDFAQGHVVSLKGDAKVKITSPTRGAAFDLFAAVALPASLHLEALDFFGRPQAMVLSDGARFGAWDMANGRYYRGRATAQNLARILPVVMPPPLLAATLLGRAERLEPAERTFTFDEKKGAFVITLTQGEVRQVLEVQPPSYRVVRVRWEGRAGYDLDFEDIAPFGSFTFPRLLRLTAPEAKESVELRYKDISLNESPEASLFDTEPPPNVTVVPVDDGNAPAPQSLVPPGAPR